MSGATVVIDALGPGLQWQTAFARVLLGMLSGLVIGRLRDTLAPNGAAPRRGPPRPSGCATSSGTASTCSRRRTAARARSARRSSSTRRSARSSASCGGSSPSSGRRSSSWKATPRRRWRRPAAAPARSSRPATATDRRARCSSACSTARSSCGATSPSGSPGTKSSSRSACAASSSRRSCSAPARSGCSSLSRDRRRVQRGRGRARLPARPPRRDRGAEHPRVRSGAAARRGARASRAARDFVSLVSHELRSPMAAVIGAARTLQDRWRMLTAEQRETFLALIGDETTRLAELVGTSSTRRGSGGDVHYRFERRRSRPRRRRGGRDGGARAAGGAGRRFRSRRAAGDRVTVPGSDRCSANLIENSVKYLPEGGEVPGVGCGGERRGNCGAGRGTGHPRRPAVHLREVRPGERRREAKPGRGSDSSSPVDRGGARDSLEVSSGGRARVDFTLTLPVGR